MTGKRSLIPVTFVVVLCIFAGSAALYAFTPSGLLEIHQINVQQGESALVIGPDGTTVLLDAGNNGKGAQIVAYFQSLGLNPVDGLDYTIGGHMDADHVGGFDEVFQSGYDVLVENWYNGSPKSTATVDDYKAAAAQTTAGPVIQAVLGDTIPLGNGAILTVVAGNGDVIGHGSVPGALDNENDMSIAVLIEYGDFDYIWASDLGGGADDNACTGRSTSQVNVETPLAQAITPGGGWPLLSAAGVDVVHVNHHGSESSTNSDYMNLLKPEVAVIPVGAGQGSTWHHPRQDVVESVLQAQASCVTAPAVDLVLQTEEGSPTGGNTSFAGFAVGDIKISTDGVTNYTIEATGAVSQGPDERVAAALPRTLPLDEGGGGGGNTPPSVTISAPANGSSFASGTPVSFTGSATDAEDGNLTANLSWTSSLDGVIGSGGSFSTSTLSIGTHNVSAAVTDSGGLSGSDSIQVTITGAGGGGGDVVLSEVLYDVSSSDDGWEWVELYNSGSGPVDLSGFCLGNGGNDYLYSTTQLSGSIASGATFVVGGPSSGANNANPSFDQVLNFSPDFQNSGTAGDGVALFDVPCSSVNISTVPIDAVIYGPNNSNGLIDETGSANAPEVGDASPNSSIERLDLSGNWQIQGSPNPNATPLPPPAGNTAPAVTITAPADGSSFDQGQSVSFTGTASDTEDGDLSASLSWTSDLDGTIGSGASFSTSTLAVGTHTITASVTDSGGLSGSDAISVTINAVAGSPGDLLLSEVLYDLSGADEGLEWVEIYNNDVVAIDLSGFSLGNGGADYTVSKVQLSGILQPGATFVVGGPTSSGANGNPAYDQIVNFNPDFQNSGTEGDGVALFNLPASSVDAATLPIDAVVYGPNNNNGLIDESGTAGAPEVGDAPAGSSIERLDVAGNWQIQAGPTPGTTPLNSPGGSTTVTFTSIASEDGWVRESSESSNVGGRNSSGNSGTTALRAGDNNRDRQYKGVVSFDTSSIPDGATITSVTLRLRRGTVAGTNPFSTHGVCWVDVHSGGLGGSTALTNSDFEAAAVARSATLSNAAANGDWSEADLDAVGLGAVNKTGTTQLRFYSISTTTTTAATTTSAITRLTTRLRPTTRNWW